MRTAIVIPTYQRPQSLERLLVSLAQCRFPPDVEIYVVENGPAGGAEDVCRRNPVENRVRYLYSPVAVKSVALNVAIQASGADFLIFFDDDVTLPPSIVADYVDAGQRYGPGHFFGGPLAADAEIPCPPHLLPFLPPSATGRSLGDHESEVAPSRFDYFFGANWAAFHSDLVAAGCFAEDLGITAARRSLVGEETELQARLVGRSVRAIYLAGALVHHRVPRECYTVDWVRNRNFRQGFTEWKLTGSKSPVGRHLFGMPLWKLRELLKLKLWMLGPAFARLTLAEQTRYRVEEARLAGWLHGCRTAESGWRNLFRVRLF